jgi:chromosome segregation ATPase
VWEILPILLSIGLFIITLIVIFTLRSADRRDRKLDVMRRYVAQYMAEVKRAEVHMQERVVEFDHRLAENKQSMELLVNQITSQREGLLSHSEDLNELQKTLTYYHQVLGQLSAMTEKAEIRTRQVKEEVSKVEQVQTIIDKFSIKIAESEELVHQQDERLEHIVNHHKVRMERQVEESVADAKIAIDALIDESLNHTDITFQTMISTVQAFLRELNNRTEIVEGVLKRLTTSSLSALDELELVIAETKKEIEEHEQVLATIMQKREAMESSIETLVQRKKGFEEELEKNASLLGHQEQKLKELEQQVKTVQDELDIALGERQRLIEEEELRELEMKARLDNPDMYEKEVDSEDIVPIFTAPQQPLVDNEEELPDLGLGQPDIPEMYEQEDDFEEVVPVAVETHQPKKKQVDRGPYELEEDEEEIILDDDSDSL